MPRPLAQIPSQPQVRHDGSADALAQQEKASIEHHEILMSLEKTLSDHGWIEIQEIPCAVDLWARPPDGGDRVIFEAKTITSENELIQTRHGLAQLMEYRVRYGVATDRLCIVGNRQITPVRVGLLERLGVAVLWWDGNRLVPGGSLWCKWVGKHGESSSWHR